MKLHLPMAVLASILCTMTAAATASYEYTGNTDSNNDGVYDGKVTFTGTGDLTGVNFYHTSYGAGVVGALPHSGPDGNVPTQHTAPSSEIILTDAKAFKVATSGVCGYAVTGDRALTVNNSRVEYIYGGYMDSNGGEVQLFDQPSWTNTHFAPKGDSGATISINVCNGSDVDYISGGSYYTTSRLQDFANNYLEEGKTTLDYPDNPLVSKEAVNITISDSTVDNVYGVQSATSIDNTVSITINDNADDGKATTIGYLYGGGTSYRNEGTPPEENYVINSFVKSTHVTLNGGTVTASFYGGGRRTAGGSVVKEGTIVEINGGTVNKSVWGGSYDGEVYGGTVVKLSGGTVKENVYAAGNGDTIYGDTKVIITGVGTDVKGTINGDGTNGSVVKGDRILSFDDYTGGVKDDAGVTQLTETERTKYQGFNVLEVKNMSANLGDVSSYDKLSIENSSASISLLTMENGAEVNNAGSLELTNVIMTGGSSFVQAGETTIQGELSLNNAMLTFSPASLQSSTGGITFVSTENGAPSITSLSDLQISATFDDATVDALLEAPYSQEVFSFVVFEGLENLEDTSLIVSLADTFNKDMLTLHGIDSEGFLQNLSINDAQMTYNATAGTLTVSGIISVPEPTTATLSLLALAGLAARRRRK